MAYDKQSFIDYPNEGYTTLKAEHLDHIEDGIVDIYKEAANSMPRELPSDIQKDENNRVLLRSVLTGGYYVLDLALSIGDLPRNISYQPTALIVERISSHETTNQFTRQLLGSILKNVDTWYCRVCNYSGTTWTDWTPISPNNGFNREIDIGSNSHADVVVDLNTITDGGYYILDTRWTVNNYPTTSTYKPTAVIVEKLSPDVGNRFVKQTIGSCYSLVDTWYYRVTNSNGVWSDWRAITPPVAQTTGTSTTSVMSQNAITTLGNGFPKDATSYTTIDNNGKSNITLGNITEGGYYIIDTTWIVSDLPSSVRQGYVSGLHVERHVLNSGTRFVKQIAYSITGAMAQQYWRVSKNNGTWTDWVEIGTGGDTYNNTYNNEIVTNVYTNQYTVTATPTITTGTNNFLASTNDTRDRTSDIITMLSQTGFCQLGPGNFYVSNLHIPAGTTLSGSGYNTNVILPDSVTDGYAIRLNNYCTVRDMHITSQSSISLNENVGTRHGIMYQGTYNDNSDAGGKYMFLSNLHIDNFTGGGITCYNTGYSTSSGIEASNIVIAKCNAGINISYWSEYHRFTNVNCNGCYYGCINNGGNNVFVNCGFNSNKVGFMIDNSLGDKPNDAHGSALGCTINHSDSNSGYAIKIYNSSPGYVFEGCQVFYGKTLIDQSDGIVFTGCNFGNNEGIDVNAGGTVLYNGCTFGSAPSVRITSNNYTRFVNCYLRSGAAVTI